MTLTIPAQVARPVVAATTVQIEAAERLSAAHGQLEAFLGNTAERVADALPYGDRLAPVLSAQKLMLGLSRSVEQRLTDSYTESLRRGLALLEQSTDAR